MAIQFKGSNVPTVTPDLEELEVRELGINTADGKLFTNDGSAIIEIGASNINTGLETFTNGGTGWRLVGINQSALIGDRAIDLTSLSLSGVVAGAKGADSITIGTDNLADTTALKSVSIGYANLVYSPESIGIGIGNNVSGTTNNYVFGKNNIVRTNDNLVLGSNNDTVGNRNILIGSNNIQNSISANFSVLIGEFLLSGDDGVSLGRYNTGDNANHFEIGNGTGAGDRRNIFEVKDNGVGVLPQATINSNIVSAGNQAIITLGFLTDSSVVGVSSVNGFSGDVILDTSHINESAVADRYYVSLADRTQITTNKTDIANLSSNTEGSIPLGAGNQIWSTNVGATDKIWIDPRFDMLFDTPDYQAGDAGKILRVNGTDDGILFDVLDKNDVGLGLVENMSPTMLATSPNLPDNTTANLVYDTFEILRTTKVSGPTPDGEDINNVLSVFSADGLGGYATEWVAMAFLNLADVPLVDINANAKFIQFVSDVPSAILAQDPIFNYVDLTQANVVGLETRLTGIESNVSNNTSAIGVNNTNIGTLANLTTTAQDNLVNAINEVNATASGSVDLAYTASEINGIVTNTGGTDATLLLADGTNAGLLAPAEFTKLGFVSVTQAIDLDLITITTAVNLDTNTTNIATNTTNIATNTTSISTNATDIATNTASIATNATDIATNTASIATNATDIDTNTASIATNITDIATNTTNIATNTTNIATNTTNISNIQLSLADGQQGLTYSSVLASYTASGGEYLFGDSTAGVMTITLPVGVIGSTIYILDVATSFVTANVTVTPNGTETIMGDTTLVLSADNVETKLVYTGSDWRVI